MQDQEADRAEPAPRPGVEAQTAEGRPWGSKWWVLGAVALSTLMGTTDASMVSIALPTLTGVFNTDAATVVWVSLASQLVVTGILLTMGRAADVLGHKRVYLTGLLVYTAGLALSATAQGILPLIFFRGFQGVGNAMTMAPGNAILVAAFPRHERGKALGILEAVVGIGLMTGPALGGLLLDTLGWRAVFYLRVPIGVLASIVAVMVLKEQAPKGRPMGLDPWGAATLFIGLSAFILGINQGDRRGWGSPLVLGLEATAAASLALFLLIERRAAQPVVDLRLFRSRPFGVATATLALYATGTVSLSFVMPFYLITGLGHTASQAGLVMMTVPFMLLLLSPWTGWLSDRVGGRLLTTAGLALQSLALFLLSRLGLGASITDVALALGVSGVGGALFFTPTYSAIMGAVPSQRLGSVSALIPTLRNVGHAAGLAVTGAVFAAQRAGHLRGATGGPEAEAGAVVAGFQEALLAMAAIAFVAFLASLFRGPTRGSERSEPVEG